MEVLSSGMLKQYNYFSALSDSALEELSKKMETVDVPSGNHIIKQGTPPDFFYFVKKGEVEVVKETPSGQPAKISVISTGQGFGEVAMLTCSHRASSVISKTDVILYRLAKKDFEDIIMTDSAFTSALAKKVQDYSQYNKMKVLQPFALLEPAKMYAVMEKMSEKKYAPGENIIVQGEKGDNYYIIKSGSVAVLKKKKGEDDHNHVTTLNPGEAFGEEALIREDPRNATCRAVDETTVFVLNKKDFDQIVKSAFLDNIFPEEISLDTYLDDFVIIDARIPAEYEEEHIYGATNIPVEVLRNKCAEFDKSKQYVTYCLNDSRGMVAAFLLKNRGFNARCLRGGISGWEGKVVTGSDGIHMPKAV